MKYFISILLFLLSLTGVCATYTVTNTNDSGSGSLRQAITTANAAPGADNVYFNIPDTDPNYNAGTGCWTIALTTQLPMITTGNINIDARTQESNQGNRNIYGYEIILNKNGTFDYPFLLVSPGNSIKGFTISGFPYGIMIYNSTATGNTISENFIGCTYRADTAAASPNQHGIAIANGASGNSIFNNVISGNTVAGIAITGATGNNIYSNRIGCDSSGMMPVPNYVGIAIQDASSNNIGSTSGQFNLISGNSMSGIVIDGLSSTNNKIYGNRIGTTIDGLDSLPNESGIILSYANSTTIGGSTYAHRNIISGNTNMGIVLNGTGTRQNTITGNFIGADITGMAPLPNYGGIAIKSNAHSNTIGGTTNAERNIISANYEMGIYVEASDSNLIINNFIGPDSTGTDAFYLGGDTLLQGNGIEFNTVAAHNTLGGYTAQERNIVSGNRVYGMVYYGNCSYNPVIGNYIGVDVTGNNPLPNATGICVDGGSNHNPILNNVLSGNYSYGIFIVTTGTYYNTFQGNIVGLNASGTDTVPNDAGLLIGGGTKYNIIGGTAASERNIISGNRYGGIEIADIGTNENLIQGNYIGTDITGLQAMPNEYGISIITFPANNTIDSNVISGNNHYGILMFEFADSNIISNNYIGLGADSLTALTNGTVGIVLWNGSSYNHIYRNAIANHDSCGIAVKDNNTLYNTLSENSIYSNSLMGIEIFPEGPNTNDGGDTDTGPNELMNTPVISYASWDCLSFNFWIYGTLDTENPAGCIIEIFEAQPDSIFTWGEGKKYIGSTTCDANGDWMFNGYSIPYLTNVTTTATSLGGSTSEFSENHTVIAGIEEPEKSFSVFPNPCQNHVQISSKKQIERIELYNLQGKLIQKKIEIGTFDYQLNFEQNIPSGSYIISIISDNTRESRIIEILNQE
ncbi:MAG: right-handed parallel beta-helix repeat-containing protein [Bacteroidales bacterium]|nr:right-handed parallel beta-helix repeat-containing protein [Bacteroidales bacterium]